MCIKDYILAIALQLIEPALWKTKAEDNAKYDGTGDLDGFHPVGRTLRRVIHDEVIGCIVDAGTRN